MILDSRDGAVANLDVKNAWGAVIQAGVDVPLNSAWFLFADLKKDLSQDNSDRYRARIRQSSGGGEGASRSSAGHAGVGWRF